MNLSGQIALVTGAARRVGKAIARELAGRGAEVWIHFGSSGEQAERTAAELRQEGATAHTAGADLARPEEIERLFARVGEHSGGLDLLVNSAASFVDRPFEEISVAEWDRVLAVNLRAPFLCLQQALPWMRRRRSPERPTAAVVNISDLSALQTWTGYAHHGASKAALVQLTRMTALELAPEVRVNAVVPGAILPPPGADPEAESWRTRGERVPLGRTGTVEEVARAVAFLAESDFLTGVVLPVDGGEHLTGREASTS